MTMTLFSRRHRRSTAKFKQELTTRLRVLCERRASAHMHSRCERECMQRARVSVSKSIHSYLAYISVSFLRIRKSAYSHFASVLLLVSLCCVYLVPNSLGIRWCCVALCGFFVSPLHVGSFFFVLNLVFLHSVAVACVQSSHSKFDRPMNYWSIPWVFMKIWLVPRSHLQIESLVMLSIHWTKEMINAKLKGNHHKMRTLGFAFRLFLSTETYSYQIQIPFLSGILRRLRHRQRQKKIWCVVAAYNKTVVARNTTKFSWIPIHAIGPRFAATIEQWLIQVARISLYNTLWYIALYLLCVSLSKCVPSLFPCVFRFVIQCSEPIFGVSQFGNLNENYRGQFYGKTQLENYFDDVVGRFEML